MKKITYILILLLVFNDVLYSKTQVECGDVIELRKHSSFYLPGFYLQGEYYYKNKKIWLDYQFYEIFNCINADELDRLSFKMNIWGDIGYLSGFFGALSIVPSIIFTTEGLHNKSTKISWSITGGLLLLNIISSNIYFYYQEKAVDTYNRIIMDNNSIMDDKSSKNMYNKNIDIFSVSYSHKLDF